MKYMIKMKNSIVKIFMLLAVSLATVSCSDDEIPVETLEVIPVNLHGAWRLDELNGEKLPEGFYVYIDFNRKGTFKLYQNNDSMYPRCITGTFSIEKDINTGSIISGVYDYDQGVWNNDYIVTDLLETGSMIWTSKDGDEVSKYIRVDEIPSHIQESAE